MARCTTKIEIGSEILRCVRQEHPQEPNHHRDWMIEFVRIDDTTWAVQRWSLEVEEV